MKQLVMALCVATLPMKASALSLICQDKISTGAEWVNGQWVQVKFDAGTYTLTDQVSEAGGGIDFCMSAAAKLAEMWTGSRGKCFNYGDLGQGQSFASCAVMMRGDRADLINCIINDGWGTLQVIPDGEAVRTSHFRSPSSDTDKGPRDPAYIAIGACNVIAR